jgi:NMD protein affecting ribosome stability and mRNA decay
MPKEKIIAHFGEQSFCGVLQLRSESWERLELVLEYVKGHKGLCKIVAEKKGFDVYVATKDVMNRFAKELPRLYGGSIKLSNHLVTKKRLTSKFVYRWNVLFWAFPFSAGDVVAVNGSPVLLTNVSKKISGLDLKTGKRTFFEYSHRERVERLEVCKAEVSHYKPVLTLIHPETYQPVVPENPTGRKNKQYDVVLVGPRVFLVPLSASKQP